MKKSWILIGITIVVVGSILHCQQGTPSSQATQIVKASDLYNLKGQPTGPILIQYSLKQWRSMTKDIVTIKEPLPATAAQLVVFPLPEPDFPPRDVIVRARCSSTEPNVVCVPEWTFGPRDEVVFKGCNCIVVPDEEDETPPPRESTTFLCNWTFVKSVGLVCGGDCTERGERQEKTCVPVRSILFPEVLGCSCDPVGRPIMP